MGNATQLCRESMSVSVRFRDDFDGIHQWIADPGHKKYLDFVLLGGFHVGKCPRQRVRTSLPKNIEILKDRGSVTPHVENAAARFGEQGLSKMKPHPVCLSVRDRYHVVE